MRSLNSSNMGTALRCAEQFRRRYILGEKTPPGIAMARGTGVHKASNVNFTQKIVTGVDMPVVDMLDASRDGYVNAFRNGVYLVKEEVSEKRKLINHGLNECQRLTKEYAKSVAPLIQPTNSEGYVSVDIGLDLPLAGYLDVEKQNTIHDLKTSSKKWPDTRAGKELQPVVYTLLKMKRQGGDKPRFVYNVLIAYKDSTRHQYIEVEVSDKRIQIVYHIAKRLMAMLESGVFMPCDPGYWLCDPKWCGYHGTCVYVGNGRKQWI